MKTLIKILFLSVLWFSCESSTEPEENNNRIRGYVYNNSGEPLENTAIFLTYEIEPISRPTTTINISIGENSIISVWTTDFCGDVVANLVDTENYAAGNYNIDWDATDDNGNQIVNGSYTFHLITDNLEFEQDVLLNSMQYSDLESIEGYNYHGLTDDSGYFSIPIECLSFGVTQNMTDNMGNDLGEFIVPYTIKLSAFHEDGGFYESVFYEVSPETGLAIDITLP